MANSTFIDVNKENYMKALFLDVQKQAKLMNFPETTKLIHDFIMNNPTNSDSETITSNGITKRDGCVVLHRKTK